MYSLFKRRIEITQNKSVCITNRIEVHLVASLQLILLWKCNLESEFPSKSAKKGYFDYIKS